MRAALDDPALIEHEDEVGVHDALDAVGDDEGRAVLHQVIQRLPDLRFRLQVDRGGGIIQHEDAGILEQRAGDGDALLLSAGKGDAFFSDQGGIPQREGEDHIVDGGCPRGFEHFLIADLALDAVDDILTDGAREEEGLLFDDADLLAQEMFGVIGDVAPVQVDRAGGDLIEARQQVHQGGLARPCRAEQRHGLSGGAFKAHVAEDGVILLIFKGDIFKFDITVDALRRDGTRIQHLAVFLDDLHHAGVRHQPGGHLHDHPAQGAHREDQPDDQPDIRQVAADGQVAGDHHPRRQEKSGQHLESAEDIADRPEEGMHLHQRFPLLELQRVLFFELVDLEGLPGIGFDHAHARQVLLDGGGKHRFLLLVGFIRLGDALEEDDRGEDDERHHDDRKQRQPAVQAV